MTGLALHIGEQMAGSPAGRVLTLLERVQQRPGLSAPRLAEELGVSERTVRRYVATLQELGIPVEADRGRYAGYRLQPGYRIPPLMLTTDEAVALTLALAVTNGPPRDETSTAEAALAKLLRSLPRTVSDRMADVLVAVTAPGRGGFAGGVPDTGHIAALSSGVVGGRVCRIRYRSGRDSVTDREVNPYGVVVVRGQSYLHGWCHLRRARRTFRVDRIDRVDVLAATFRTPKGLDVVAAVEESLALSRPEWQVSLLLDGPIEHVEEFIPRFLGVCERVDDVTTRVRSSTSNPDYFVLRISDHPFAMRVEEPDEVREAFGRAARRMAGTAAATGGAETQERS